MQGYLTVKIINVGGKFSWGPLDRDHCPLNMGCG